MRNREWYEKAIALSERHVARAQARLERKDLSKMDKELTEFVLAYNLDYITKYTEEMKECKS